LVLALENVDAAASASLQNPESHSLLSSIVTGLGAIKLTVVRHQAHQAGAPEPGLRTLDHSSEGTRAREPNLDTNKTQKDVYEVDGPSIYAGLSFERMVKGTVFPWEIVYERTNYY